MTKRPTRVAAPPIPSGWTRRTETRGADVFAPTLPPGKAKPKPARRPTLPPKPAAGR